MNKVGLRVLLVLALAFGMPAAHVLAQDVTAPAAAAAAEPGSGFDVLVGEWVRPDGGYRISIRSVDAGGGLDASYANPQSLPFAKAEASRDGETIKVFLELRAGGYNGSTYKLTYDPVNDLLLGVYYQAVAQQKFNIYFQRAR